ncbi:hypothetical protein QO014_002126 [Kaistia dalseonensis]|uniref:Uncharacterized protein n=1 Tax=Kaistia dalseonensis TaxID=410840 RepID=A0ABU0H5Z3_9HYPH|nr:hypothetical protein [Kaistia dalseonensis]
MGTKVERLRPDLKGRMLESFGLSYKLVETTNQKVVP